MAAGSGKAAVSGSKSRLGRGLSSLIRVSVPEEPGVGAEAQGGEGANPPAAVGGGVQGEQQIVERIVERVKLEATGEPVMVDVGQIRANPHQPRKTFTEVNLKELAESIKSNGVIQPLVVRRMAGGREYELIAGERRLRASKLAGLEKVPCVVKEIDGLTQAQMALVENIQREDLNPLERAEGYRTLMNQLGLTQAELAGRLGEERSTIANFVRLLDLAEPVRRLIREGKLSLGHGKLLAGVADVLEQERLGNLVVSQELSVRNLEKVIAGLPVKVGPPAAAVSESKAAGREAHYLELEKSLSRQLGLRVQLKAGKGKGKGKVTIHYGSLDQFDSLLEKLGVEVE